jgi:serine/threonine protein kinase
MKESDHPFQI